MLSNLYHKQNLYHLSVKEDAGYESINPLEH